MDAKKQNEFVNRLSSFMAKRGYNVLHTNINEGDSIIIVTKAKVSVDTVNKTSYSVFTKETWAIKPVNKRDDS